jgi:hypothetical protein
MFDSCSSLIISISRLQIHRFVFDNDDNYNNTLTYAASSAPIVNNQLAPINLDEEQEIPIQPDTPEDHLPEPGTVTELNGLDFIHQHLQTPPRGMHVPKLRTKCNTVPLPTGPISKN